jgi:hypothetical protein
MRYFWTAVPHTANIAVIAMAILVGLILDRANVDRYLAEQQFHVLEETYELQVALELEISEKLWLTEGLVSAIAAQPRMSQDDFGRSAAQLFAATEDVINVAAAPDLVIDYVYPVAGNESALGLDLARQANLTGAVREAIDTGETIFTGPVELVQGGQGFITRAAVFLPSAETDDAALWGIVSLVVDADGLFVTAGLDGALVPNDFVVRDGTGRVLAGDPDVSLMEPVSIPVTAPGIGWVLEAAPRGGWSTSPPNRASLWLAVLLVTLTLLALYRVLHWAFNRKVEAETQLEEAVEALSDGFALYDSEGKLTMCNQTYRNFFPSSADLLKPGTSFETILRRGIENGQYPAAVGREDEWIAERIEAHRNPTEPTEFKTPDGRWLRVEERLTPSNSVAGVLVDITQLKQAVARSAAANAAKTDFLNTVSHELRTPLSVILGYNSFMRNLSALPSYRWLKDDIETENLEKRLTTFSNDIKKFSDQIETSGKHLLALIASVLDIAAIEEGTLQLNPETLNMDDTLSEVVSQMQVVAQKKGISLVVESESGDVWADPVRLRQILLNIIGNAIKFTDEGSVQVHSYFENGRSCVEVKDTGPGIAPEILDTIFDRFRQADETSSRKHGGIGLGLSIAKELAELHNGSIEVDSTLGEGTTFRVVLPCQEPDSNGHSKQDVA